MYFYFWLYSVFDVVHVLSLVAASGGWSLVVVYRLLIVMAPLCRAWALGCTGFRSCAHRLSHCCSQALENRLRSFEAWAWLLHSIWNLRRTGIEPVSLALTGSFLSISHQGIPNTWDTFKVNLLKTCWKIPNIITPFEPSY